MLYRVCAQTHVSCQVLYGLPCHRIRFLSRFWRPATQTGLPSPRIRLSPPLPSRQGAAGCRIPQGPAPADHAKLPGMTNRSIAGMEKALGNGRGKMFWNPQETQKAKRNQWFLEGHGRSAEGSLPERGENRSADGNALGGRREKRHLGHLFQDATPEQGGGKAMDGKAGRSQVERPFLNNRSPFQRGKKSPPWREREVRGRRMGASGTGAGVRGDYSRPKRRKSFVESPGSMPSMAMEVPVTVTAASVASRHVPESRSSVT